QPDGNPARREIPPPYKFDKKKYFSTKPHEEARRKSGNDPHGVNAASFAVLCVALWRNPFITDRHLTSHSEKSTQPRIIDLGVMSSIHRDSFQPSNLVNLRPGQ